MYSGSESKEEEKKSTSCLYSYLFLNRLFIYYSLVQAKIQRCGPEYGHDCDLPGPAVISAAMPASPSAICWHPRGCPLVSGSTDSSLPGTSTISRHLGRWRAGLVEGGWIGDRDQRSHPADGAPRRTTHDNTRLSAPSGVRTAGAAGRIPPRDASPNTICFAPPRRDTVAASKAAHRTPAIRHPRARLPLPGSAD